MQTINIIRTIKKTMIYLEKFCEGFIFGLSRDDDDLPSFLSALMGCVFRYMLLVWIILLFAR